MILYLFHSNFTNFALLCRSRKSMASSAGLDDDLHRLAFSAWQAQSLFDPLEPQVTRQD